MLTPKPPAICRNHAERQFVNVAGFDRNATSSTFCCSIRVRNVATSSTVPAFGLSALFSTHFRRNWDGDGDVAASPRSGMAMGSKAGGLGQCSGTDGLTDVSCSSARFCFRSKASLPQIDFGCSTGLVRRDVLISTMKDFVCLAMVLEYGSVMGRCRRLISSGGDAGRLLTARDRDILMACGFYGARRYTKPVDQAISTPHQLRQYRGHLRIGMRLFRLPSKS